MSSLDKAEASAAAGGRVVMRAWKGRIEFGQEHQSYGLQDYRDTSRVFPLILLKQGIYQGDCTVSGPGVVNYQV